MSGTALVVAAIALITVSRSFDGFVQGLLAGAGVALVLIGVATLSPLLRRSSGRTSGAGRESTASDPDDPARGWLPSRDTRP